MSSFSYSQQVAIAIIPKITGSLSLMGSIWIIIEVLSQKTKRNNVYNRFLCVMSLFDALTSSWMFASTWPVPEGTEGVTFAVGNTRTCIAQGFFLQVAIISPLYNFCLAFYYMLVVKYNVSEDKLRLYFEPVAHLFCIIFGFGPAIAGLPLDLYNNAELWCWIAPFPEDCLDTRTYGESEGTCSRGDKAWIYRWAFFFVPLWIVIALVTIIMVVVYRSVRQLEDEVTEHFYEQGNTRRSSVLQAEVNRSSAVEQDGTTGGSHHLRRSFQGPSQKRRPTLLNEISDRLLEANALMIPKVMANMMNSTKSESLRSKANTEDVDYVLDTIEGFTTAQHQCLELNQFGSQAVFWQAVFYTAAFYICYTFATINRMAEQITGKSSFGIIVMHVLLLPLQGFFNVFIYRYGYYVRLKQRYPNLRSWELFQDSLRWSFLGPPPDKKQDETSKQVAHLTAVENLNPVDAPRTPPIKGNKNTVGNVLHDEFGARSPVGTMVADMLLSYSEYPNMASSNDMVMVSTHFPTMVGQDSFSQMRMPSLTDGNRKDSLPAAADGSRQPPTFMNAED